MFTRSRSSEEAMARNGVENHEADRSERTPTEQAAMLSDARASVCGYLTNLIGRRLDVVSYALYPNLGPIEASKHLSRNLRGDQGRKVGLSEVDAILDVLGREDEEKYLRFILRRRGIRPPAVFDRDGEVERLAARVDELEADNAAKDATIREMAEAFAARKEDA